MEGLEEEKTEKCLSGEQAPFPNERYIARPQVSRLTGAM